MSGTPDQRAWVERVLGLRFADNSAAVPARGPAPALSLVKLAKARLGWQQERVHAVEEIHRLSAALAQRFGAIDTQKSALQAALKRLESLVGSLNAELETRLDEVLNAADPAKRAALSQGVKAMVAGVAKLITGDPVMVALDGNEVLADMQVTGPLRRRMADLVGALI